MAADKLAAASAGQSYDYTKLNKELVAEIEMENEGLTNPNSQPNHNHADQRQCPARPA